MTKQYSKKVAFFDLDGTLVKKDTYSLFIKCLQDNKLCDEQFIQKDKELLKQFVNGTLNMEEFFRFALLPLINLNKAQIKEITDNYIENYLRPYVYEDALKLVNSYKSKGYYTIIVSATIDVIVQPIASKIFNVDHSISTEAIYNNNIIIGEVDPMICHQENKAIKLKKYCKENFLTLEGSHGYGDTINDKELLQCATYAHATNPHPLLKDFALTNNWDIIYFNK